MSEIYPKPSITGDVIVYDVLRDKVLLIKRKSEPYAGCWAIVGGFFNAEPHHGEPQDESVRAAAIRELKEEVNIDFREDFEGTKMDFDFVTVQDKPNRDPRGRVVTLVYACTIYNIFSLDIKAQDDAAEVQWFSLTEVVGGKVPLAFDHLDSIQKFARGTRY